MESIVKLFKALPIEEKKKAKPSSRLLEACISNGIIFSEEVIYNYSEEDLLRKIDRIRHLIGLSPKDMNSSFHKSWRKVRDTPMFHLVLEQIVHYITTYGYEMLGIYDSDRVFIPAEELDIPSLKDGVYLTVIKGYTPEEIKDKLLSLLSSGIALKEDTVRDAMNVILYLISKDVIDESFLELIKNREVRCLSYEYLGLVPRNPVEMLRLMVYESTGSSLLIKSEDLLLEIHSKQNINVLRSLKQYELKYGLESLGSIFYRFKPIFLAFRTNPELRRYVNRIRRLAKRYHQPMTLSYLDTVTARINRGETIDSNYLRLELNKANIFRKTRLAYALHYRMRNPSVNLFKIRNGKAYVKEYSFNNIEEAERVYDIVMDSIVSDLSHLKDKSVYIPNYMVYALPTTEKQFTGDIPSGSYVKIDSDMVFGVHWNNVGDNRIDLDLSLIDTEYGKIGWDSRYKLGDEILFSGDMTDATNGASELFYVKRVESSRNSIVFLNYYNYSKDISVPYKILVAKEHLDALEENYMVDPNNVKCITTSNTSSKQKVLGIVTMSPTESRFYFSECTLGSAIASRINKVSIMARDYLVTKFTNPITLSDVLVKAGCELVDSKEDADIDLSPNKLERGKIISLLTG